MDKKIKLDNETKENMIKEIKSYFLDERDEELGDLGAMLVLDFIIEKIAPEFYNQGVYDSYKYINQKIEDVLEIQK